MPLPRQQTYHEEMFFHSGTVQQILDKKYIIMLAQRRVIAVRAAGCLLIPEVGDTVLFVEGPAKIYILSILTRDDMRPAQVSLPADSMIAAKNGNLLLRADGKIALTAPDLGFYADNGVAEIKKTDFTGNRVEISIHSLSTFCQTVERKVDRVLERIAQLYRRVGSEDSRLGQVHCSVEESYSVEAQEVSIEADERLRLDGERVELG